MLAKNSLILIVRHHGLEGVVGGDFLIHLSPLHIGGQDAVEGFHLDITLKIGEKIEAEYKPPRDFVKGDNVTIASLGKDGVIDKIDGEKVTVLIGSARFNTKIKELRLITEKKDDNKKKSGTKGPRKIMEAKSEVDVRGFIGDDAIFVVDKFLDDAVLSGLVNVRIIHGKGTGALRKALWDYFKRDKRIAEFRMGTFGEGDSGVTVVTLK